MTVLVVDDHEPVLKMVKVLLEKNGHVALAAASCDDALNLYAASSRPIDLVILDLDMPGVNGFQTLSRLRQIDEDVRAVLMSGGAVDPEEITRSGFLGFLPKPFSISRLLALTNAAGPTLSHRIKEPC